MVSVHLSYANVRVYETKINSKFFAVFRCQKVATLLLSVDISTAFHTIGHGISLDRISRDVVIPTNSVREHVFYVLISKFKKRVSFTFF